MTLANKGTDTAQKINFSIRISLVCVFGHNTKVVLIGKLIFM